MSGNWLLPPNSELYCHINIIYYLEFLASMYLISVILDFTCTKGTLLLVPQILIIFVITKLFWGKALHEK